MSACRERSAAGPFYRLLPASYAGKAAVLAYVTLAPAPIGERMGLDEVADGSWAVYVDDSLLGHLHERAGHIQGVDVRTKTSR